MKLKLQQYRFYQSPTCTGSHVDVCGQNYSILELPWIGNERGISCIPANTYQLKRHYGTSKNKKAGLGYAWEIMDVPERSLIYFAHVGCFPKNSRGCSLVGMRDGFAEHNERLFDSVKAVSAMYKAMSVCDEIELEIIECFKGLRQP